MNECLDRRIVQMRMNLMKRSGFNNTEAIQFPIALPGNCIAYVPSLASQRAFEITMNNFGLPNCPSTVFTPSEHRVPHCQLPRRCDDEAFMAKQWRTHAGETSAIKYICHGSPECGNLLRIGQLCMPLHKSV
jgi:hypothetical protein